MISSFPSSDMANFFQISKSVFSIFPIPSGDMAKIFKFQKQKISIQISKTKKNQLFLVA
jgi:hypothetical protein